MLVYRVTVIVHQPVPSSGGQFHSHCILLQSESHFVLQGLCGSSCIVSWSGLASFPSNKWEVVVHV